MKLKSLLQMPVSTILLFSLIQGIPFLSGCGGFSDPIDIIAYPLVEGSMPRRDLNPNDLPINSYLNIGLPILEPIVINVNAFNEENFMHESIKQGLDKKTRYHNIHFPLWYIAENSALESFSNLSSDVSIAREIDKPDSLDEALIWYENKAKEDPKSAYKLGLLYHIGREVPINYNIAKTRYVQSDIPAAIANIVGIWEAENKGSDLSSDMYQLELDTRRYMCGLDYANANCKYETIESRINMFRDDQKLIVDTKGKDAYIFNIGFDYCGGRSEKKWPWSEKVRPARTFVLAKVYHSDGTNIGEYIYENNDNVSDRGKQLRNIAYLAYNEIMNKVVNSRSFLNHYQSLHKQ